MWSHLQWGLFQTHLCLESSCLTFPLMRLGIPAISKMIVKMKSPNAHCWSENITLYARGYELLLPISFKQLGIPNSLEKCTNWFAEYSLTYFKWRIIRSLWNLNFKRKNELGCVQYQMRKNGNRCLLPPSAAAVEMRPRPRKTVIHIIWRKKGSSRCKRNSKVLSFEHLTVL